MIKDFSGKNAFVTGGASGMGLASGEALAAVGRPVSLWDLDAEKASSAAASSAPKGPERLLII